MELFRTPTPPYEKQPDGTRTAEPTGVLGWFSSLFRTRTPAYTYPVMSARKASSPADPPKP